jgi:hypothetical protein
MAPMLPRPITPSVLLQTSVPSNLVRSHLPACSEASACGIQRASDSIRVIVCSAVVTLLPPGVFITTMPFLVAVATSMLSTPMPARPMTRRRPGSRRMSAVTRVPLRITNAS